MKIAVVGLGLIGGSLARTIREKYSSASVSGYDISPDVLKKALIQGVIHDTTTSFNGYDKIFISLYPKDTVAFLEKHIHEFSPRCLVVDACGVKELVCNTAYPLFVDSEAVFIGGHPMAGRELSGYNNSVPTLFDGASMILTPNETTPQWALSELERFFLSLGFGRVTITTPKHHDTIIAYTSQLAHVVSNAYMQSPTASEYMGFSAGSFADLTRVAKLNPQMWAELFLCNKTILVEEIDHILTNLGIIRNLIAEEKEDELMAFLKNGSDIKQRLLDQQRKGVEQ